MTLWWVDLDPGAVSGSQGVPELAYVCWFVEPDPNVSRGLCQHIDGQKCVLGLWLQGLEVLKLMSTQQWVSLSASLLLERPWDPSLWFQGPGNPGVGVQLQVSRAGACPLVGELGADSWLMSGFGPFDVLSHVPGHW